MPDIDNLLNQFKSERDRYLWLAAQVIRVRAEADKSRQRIELFRRLLELEGQNVADQEWLRQKR